MNRHPPNALASVLAGLALAALAGCGYHLRGSAHLPEGVETVQVSAPTALMYDELKSQLDTGDVKVVAYREGVDAVLRVGAEQFDRRVLSFDPDTGKEREFELSYTVYFGLSRADGTDIVSWQKISLLRDFVFDPDSVIGKSREEGVLYDEMRRDAVQQMLRRIQAATAG